MMEQLVGRIDVRAEQIERRRLQIDVRALVLLVITAIFWTLGFVVSWTVHAIWLVIRWTLAAMAEGWSDGKIRASGARSA